MKAFNCGEKVPVSGIYKVFHLLPHNGEQREMYFEGSRFPLCRRALSVGIAVCSDDGGPYH